MRIIIFTMGLLLSSFAVAQPHSHEPLLQDGKVWNYKLHYVKGYAEFLTCDSKYWIDGDTVIDGRTCYKVFSADQYEDGVESKVRYMYEEDGKVYGQAGQETMLYYDFGLSGGDCFAEPLFCPEENMVERCDTVFVKGHARKRIFFSWGPESAWCWVEGIGGRAALDQPFGNPFSDGKRYELVSCFLGDECLFEEGDFNTQDPYFPMLQDGKKWVTTINSDSYTHYIEGDTLIGGNTWKKVYANNYDLSAFSYYGAIREEGDKVYGIASGRNEPRLLYDFGLNVGDKLLWKEESLPEGMPHFYYICYWDDPSRGSYGVGHKITVEDIDTIQVYGHEFRRITLKSMYIIKAPPTSSGSATSFNPYYVWVEGIGCEGGLFVSGRKIKHDSELYCMMNDSVIFEYGDFHLPGVTAGIKAVPKSIENGDIYDLQGRRLLSAPAKGLYIQSGRKFLVR